MHPSTETAENNNKCENGAYFAASDDDKNF